MTTFGPTFGPEVIAAGLGGLPFSWTEDEIFGRENLDEAQNATLDEVVAAHDPTAVLPPAVIPADIAEDHEARIQSLEVQAGLRAPP
jgi:hypothetical protein